LLVALDESEQTRRQEALSHLKTAEPPVSVISSRTDAGVNALGNTFHVDIARVGINGQVRWG
jgi:tRNA U38,U39,U40 pseudouridine synthase TruA